VVFKTETILLKMVAVSVPLALIGPHETTKGLKVNGTICHNLIQLNENIYIYTQIQIIEFFWLLLSNE
jgi:hypothetical protein